MLIASLRHTGSAIERGFAGNPANRQTISQSGGSRAEGNGSKNRRGDINWMRARFAPIAGGWIRSIERTCIAAGVEFHLLRGALRFAKILRRPTTTFTMTFPMTFLPAALRTCTEAKGLILSGGVKREKINEKVKRTRYFTKIEVCESFGFLLSSLGIMWNASAAEHGTHSKSTYSTSRNRRPFSLTFSPSGRQHCAHVHKRKVFFYRQELNEKTHTLFHKKFRFVKFWGFLLSRLGITWNARAAEHGIQWKSTVFS